MSESNTSDSGPSAPAAHGALREVRYSLREMMAEVKEERKQSALGRELVDTTEIKKMFGRSKRKKKKAAE